MGNQPAALLIPLYSAIARGSVALSGAFTPAVATTPVFFFSSHEDSRLWEIPDSDGCLWDFPLFRLHDMTLIMCFHRWVSYGVTNPSLSGLWFCYQVKIEASRAKSTSFWACRYFVSKCKSGMRIEADPTRERKATRQQIARQILSDPCLIFRANDKNKRKKERSSKRVQESTPTRQLIGLLCHQGESQTLLRLARFGSKTC